MKVYLPILLFTMLIITTIILVDVDQVSAKVAFGFVLLTNIVYWVKTWKR